MAAAKTFRFGGWLTYLERRLGESTEAAPEGESDPIWAGFPNPITRHELATAADSGGGDFGNLRLTGSAQHVL